MEVDSYIPDFACPLVMYKKQKADKMKFLFASIAVSAKKTSK